MTIIRCHSCGKEIARQEESVSIALGSILLAITLCVRCGTPAAKLFKQVKANDGHRIERERNVEA